MAGTQALEPSGWDGGPGGGAGLQQGLPDPLVLPGGCLPHHLELIFHLSARGREREREVGVKKGERTDKNTKRDRRGDPWNDLSRQTNV